MTSPGNIVDAPKLSLCLARCFLSTNDQCAGALLCRRNQLFHAHISECLLLTASPGWPPFWNKLMVDKALFSSFVEVTAARSTDCHWHSHGHQENDYATRKPALPSLQTYCTFLQALILSLKEICVVKQKKSLYLFCSQHIRTNELTIHRSKQTADT
jgi:hypothetical protein